MTIRAEIFGSSLRDESPLLRAKKPKGARADELHSIRVVREASRCADTRAGDRQWLAGERAQLTHMGTSHDVGLINICRDGAMIAADFDGVPWDKVKLQLSEGRPIKGVILWVKEGRIGIQFASSSKLSDALIAGTSSTADAIIAEPQASLRSEDQRSEWRHVLTCAATVHYDYDSTPAKLRNVSPAGGMIETSARLAVGAEPLVDLGEAGSVFGRVAWVSGDRAGLAFDRPFEMATLAGRPARPHMN
jgi:hypothetical protein